MSKRSQHTNSFYSDVEPYNPPENRPLYWDDCTRYIVTRAILCRTRKLSKTEVHYSLSTEVWKRWNAGDLCPLSINAIQRRLEAVVLPMYEKYSKGKLPGKSHKKRKVAPVQAPTRRSMRHGENDEPVLNDEESSSQEAEQCEPVGSNEASSQEGENVKTDKQALYDIWTEDHGRKLFDVFSSEMMVKRLKDGYAFDCNFLEDQHDLNQRKLVMQVQKVTCNFVAEQKKRQRLQLKRYLKAKKDSEQFKTVKADLQSMEDLFEDDNENEMMFNDDNDEYQCDLDVSTSSNVCTRSEKKRKNSLFSALNSSVAVQTDNFVPQLSTRRDTLHGTLCAPQYLEDGGMLMALNSQSATQAIMSMYICDSIIWGQKKEITS